MICFLIWILCSSISLAVLWSLNRFKTLDDVVKGILLLIFGPFGLIVFFCSGLENGTFDDIEMPWAKKVDFEMPWIKKEDKE